MHDIATIRNMESAKEAHERLSRFYSAGDLRVEADRILDILSVWKRKSDYTPTSPIWRLVEAVRNLRKN